MSFEYRGYSAFIEYEPDDERFHGVVAGTSDVIHFSGASVKELQREFRDSVDLYLKICEEDGLEPEKPFSGKYLVRMPVELHRTAAATALQRGQSFNQWIIDAMRKALDPQADARLPVPSRPARSSRPKPRPKRKTASAAKKRTGKKSRQAAKV